MEQSPFSGKSACCFSGHRPAGLPEGEAGMLLRTRLVRCIEEAARAGVSDFYAGGAQGFDLMAADAVLLLRKRYAQLRLHLALPSRTQAARYAASDKRRYETHLAHAASVWYASEDANGPASMLSRNRYMVEHADCVIAYLAVMSGGTYYTVRYALDRELYVRNLAIQSKS